MTIRGAPPLIRADSPASARHRGRKALLALACIAAAVVALAMVRWALAQECGQWAVFEGGGMALVAVAGLGLGISRRRQEG